MCSTKGDGRCQHGGRREAGRELAETEGDLGGVKGRVVIGTGDEIVLVEGDRVPEEGVLQQELARGAAADR